MCAGGCGPAPGDCSRSGSQAIPENWLQEGSPCPGSSLGVENWSCTCAHSGLTGLRKATTTLEESGGLATGFLLPSHPPDSPPALCRTGCLGPGESAGSRRQLNGECGHAKVHCGDLVRPRPAGFGNLLAALSSSCSGSAGVRSGRVETAC